MQEHRTTSNKRYFTYPIFDAFKERFIALTLSKDFDINESEELRALLQQYIQSVSPDKNVADIFPPISFTKQTHGTDILALKKGRATYGEVSAREKREGDIFMSNEKNIPFMIRTADCACVVLFDPTSNSMANIHAGWRGIAQKAIALSVSELCKRFGANRKTIRASISPMIGPCCAQFTDPHRELPHFMRPFFCEENHVDLWAAAENQLIGSGLQANNIFNPRICTVCSPETFYSYRREGEGNGRFGTLAMLI